MQEGSHAVVQETIVLPMKKITPTPIRQFKNKFVQINPHLDSSFAYGMHRHKVRYPKGTQRHLMPVNSKEEAVTAKREASRRLFRCRIDFVPHL